MLLILGLMLSPWASAALAPDQADTFVSSSPAGDKTKNFGKDGALKVSPNASALIHFDLSTLPTGTVAADVEQGTMLLWVNKVDAAGNINVLVVALA